jgi:hypothetical protein
VESIGDHRAAGHELSKQNANAAMISAVTGSVQMMKELNSYCGTGRAISRKIPTFP